MDHGCKWIRKRVTVYQVYKYIYIYIYDWANDKKKQKAGFEH